MTRMDPGLVGKTLRRWKADMDGCGFGMLKGQEEGHVACGWREEGAGKKQDGRDQEPRWRGAGSGRCETDYSIIIEGWFFWSL